MLGSNRQYAAHRKAMGLSGGSHVAVGKAITTGRIAAAVGADGKIDFAKADALWSENTNAVQGARNPGGLKKPAEAPTVRATDTSPTTATAAHEETAPAGGNSLAKAQAMRAVYQAQREKLKFEEESGKKIDADEVRVKAFTRGRAARDKLMSAPARIGPKIVGLTDLVQIITILEDELRAVAQEIADDAASPV